MDGAKEGDLDEFCFDGGIGDGIPAGFMLDEISRACEESSSSADEPTVLFDEPTLSGDDPTIVDGDSSGSGCLQDAGGRGADGGGVEDEFYNPAVRIFLLLGACLFS